MDEAAIVQWITESFPEVEVQSVRGTHFFFYGAERMMPLVTLVTDDEHDGASNLNRPGVFRLNIGVGKNDYQQMFGSAPIMAGPSGVIETGHDFTQLDTLMPHPVYASYGWICILNPSEATMPRVRQLITEAYQHTVAKHAKKAARETTSADEQS